MTRRDEDEYIDLGSGKVLRTRDKAVKIHFDDTQLGSAWIPFSQMESDTEDLLRDHADVFSSCWVTEWIAEQKWPGKKL